MLVSEACNSMSVREDLEMFMASDALSVAVLGETARSAGCLGRGKLMSPYGTVGSMMFALGSASSYGEDAMGRFGCALHTS